MSNDDDKSKFAAKWSDLVVRRGFAPVPKCLITCMAELGLKPQEAVVLFNIVEKCWKAGDKAWPSVDYLAKAIGRKNSATREITKSLFDKGFITKERQFNKPNLYGLEPTAQKLANHMPYCSHSARNTADEGQKSGGLDSQKTSDYIEPNITRNTNIESNIYSRYSIKNGANDPSDVSGKSSYGICPNNANGDRHKWESFTTEQVDDNDELVVTYYLTCAYCGAQYHKKGEQPFGGNYEYPLHRVNGD